MDRNVKRLVETGADAAVLDAQGRTPRDVAEAAKKPRLVAALDAGP